MPEVVEPNAAGPWPNRVEAINLAGNMTLDRQAEERRRQQAVEDRKISQQLQLDFQRQQALQAEQTRIEIEEQRLFNEWRRSQGV